jgi:hypothetical protein
MNTKTMVTYKSVLFSATKEKPAKAPPKEKKVKKAPTKAKGKKGKEKAPVAPPKKLGRPSKEDIRAKAQAEHAAKVALSKEMLERQRLAATLEPEVAATMDVPKYPVFLPGQRVQSVFKRIDEKVEKGTVTYDSNIHSPMIRVNWDDGSSQYAAKVNLKPIVKKTYKKLFSNKNAKEEYDE